MHDTAGLDPTLGAILPLAGVAIGVLLGGLARVILDRRAEKRQAKVAATARRDQFRAALRLLLHDLRLMHTVVSDGGADAQGNKLSVLLANPHLQPWLTSDTWRAHQHTLALGLLSRPAEWEALQQLMFESRLLDNNLSSLVPQGPYFVRGMQQDHERFAVKVQGVIDMLSPLDRPD